MEIDRVAAATDDVNTSWNPNWDDDDFDPDFEPSSNAIGFDPKIYIPASEGEGECSFHAGWADTPSTHKEQAPPPPPEEEVTDATTPCISNVTSPAGTALGELNAKSSLQKAKQKYIKYVKAPREAKKLEETLGADAAKEETKTAAAREREKRLKKQDKFKKVIKYKSITTPSKPDASPNVRDFNPWLTPTKVSSEQTNADENWSSWKDLMSSRRKQLNSSRSEQIFRTKVGSDTVSPLPKHSTPVLDEVFSVAKEVASEVFQTPPPPPPKASLEVTPEILSSEDSDFKATLEVTPEKLGDSNFKAAFNESAITMSSSLCNADATDYDYLIEATPINARDRSFQSKINLKITETSSITESLPPRNLQQEQEEKKEPSSSPPGKMSFFTCGFINVESSPKQVMINFSRDIKTGMKNSVRNLFAQCDIGSSKGMDVMERSFEETKVTLKEDMNKDKLAMKNNVKKIFGCGDLDESEVKENTQPTKRNDTEETIPKADSQEYVAFGSQ